MKKTKIIIFSVAAIALIGLITTIVYCSKKANDDKSFTQPKILFAMGAAPKDTKIEISVEKETDNIQLFKFIKVTDGAVWNVFDSSDNLIANKVIYLNGGFNTFYIPVSFPDGSYSTTYTLSVYRPHDITVSYAYKTKFTRSETLEVVTVESGNIFKADYIPDDIYGYVFNGWLLNGRPFTEERIDYNITLYANLSPKPAKIHFVADGEEWNTIDTFFDETFEMPIAPEKDHYHYVRFNNDDALYQADLNSNIYTCRQIGDVYVYGEYCPNLYKISYLYGEIGYIASDSQYVYYGADFEIKEPRNERAIKNGVDYILSGFTYNGEPFESGKYFYDGDITVTAVWKPYNP